MGKDVVEFAMVNVPLIWLGFSKKPVGATQLTSLPALMDPTASEGATQ